MTAEEIKNEILRLLVELNKCKNEQEKGFALGAITAAVNSANRRFFS